jgi:hypothetical protein
VSCFNFYSKHPPDEIEGIEGKLKINPSTPELNPSALRCLTRYFTADFALR